MLIGSITIYTISQQRSESVVEKVARIDKVDPKLLRELMGVRGELKKGRSISETQWNQLLRASYDSNPRVREHAFSGIAAAHSGAYHSQALAELERAKHDPDEGVRCYYVGWLVFCGSSKWRQEADLAKKDPSRLVRELAKDAERNASLYSPKRSAS